MLKKRKILIYFLLLFLLGVIGVFFYINNTLNNSRDQPMKHIIHVETK